MQADDLICPITLEPFRDPVRATDGRVYEREAITRWVMAHGTSPFTREPLQLKDLQEEPRLRRLSAQRTRRKSTISTNTGHNHMNVAPTGVTINQDQSVQNVSQQLVTNAPVKLRYQCLRYALVTFVILAIFIGIVLALSLSPSSVGLPTTTYNRSTATPTWSPSTVGHMFVFSEKLTWTSPNFARPNRLSANDSYYFYQEVLLKVSSFVTVEIYSSSNLDMYGCLYETRFNPSIPSVNLIAFDDNNYGKFQFRLLVNLTSNNYTLIVTTYQTWTFGSFRVFFRRLS